VLEPARLHVPRSLARARRRRRYRFTCDTAFDRVIRACAATHRPDQDGTWITPAMVTAYGQLHDLGFAHSFEAWEEEALVGGLYGVSLGAAFFGESMFTERTDASKLAFVESVEWLAARGTRLIDCQVRTEHLVRFGAEAWPRERFLAALAEALARPTQRGRWSMSGAPG
jgi:leucyl/phenylalanyl-tRNA--protein transferase